MTGKKPMHPGLKVKEFLVQSGIYKPLSKGSIISISGIDKPTFSRLIKGRVRLQPHMCVKLHKAFPETTLRFWLQMRWDHEYERLKESTE